MTNNWTNQYQAPDLSLWEGRSDSLPNERFFQIIQCIDLKNMDIPITHSKSLGLLGFCCDLGIKRNLGRPGAAQGPNALRKALARLAVQEKSIAMYDFGNIVCENEDLEQAQESLGIVVTELLKNNITPIVFGGGHETAWGHYQGIAKAKPKNNLGIINFDSHFDLRPVLENNKGTSGSPFWQIAQARNSEKLPFSYFCLGVQKTANTRSLFQTAHELDVHFIEAEKIYLQPLHKHLHKMDNFLAHHEEIYLSLCLDVFANTIAPGVSSPQPLGLLPWQIIPFLKQIAKSKKTISLDIVELSPPLDSAGITAQLAASLLAEFIDALSNS